MAGRFRRKLLISARGKVLQMVLLLLDLAAEAEATKNGWELLIIHSEDSRNFSEFASVSMDSNWTLLRMRL